MSEEIAQLLCRRCGFTKGLDDIAVNFGAKEDGFTSAGGLCRQCAAEIVQKRESFAATIGRVLEGPKSDYPEYDG